MTDKNLKIKMKRSKPNVNVKRPKRNKPRQKGYKGINMKAVNLGTSTSIKSTNPRFNGSTSAVVSHKELVATITTSSNNFSMHTYACQPGVLAAWISQLAPLYTTYKFKKLAFIYAPSVPATTTGNVVCAWGRDPDADDPEDINELSAIAHSQTLNIYKPTEYSIPTDNKARFIRIGELTDDQYKFYDMGEFYIAINGYTGTAGFLYVEYTVQFIGPRSNNTTIMNSGTCTTIKVSSAPQYFSWYEMGLFSSDVLLYTMTPRNARVAEPGVGTVVNLTSPRVPLPDGYTPGKVGTSHPCVTYDVKRSGRFMVVLEVNYFGTEAYFNSNDVVWNGNAADIGDYAKLAMTQYFVTEGTYHVRTMTVLEVLNPTKLFLINTADHWNAACYSAQVIFLPIDANSLHALVNSNVRLQDRTIVEIMKGVKSIKEKSTKERIKEKEKEFQYENQT